MAIDPERAITITIPYGMIEKLAKAKPVLSMFSDEENIREVMQIIEAIHDGAMAFIRREDGEIMDYLTNGDEADEIIKSLDEEFEED